LRKSDRHVQHPGVRIVWGLFFLIGVLRPAAAAPLSAFHVGGAVVQPQSWTVARLNRERARDIQTVHYTLKGVAHTADFSLAELLPQFGHRAAWLTLDEDGKPLPADTGPVELIVPGDAKPGRWVHAVAVVTLIDGAQPVAASGT
jgi:hypothetical protein